MGVKVSVGLAGTGVVGSIKGRGAIEGASGGIQSIGLRADMDALPMDEANEFCHKSTMPGKFHGCGHDGHTTMLLAAAEYLAATRNFSGTVHCIFQPAEEGLGGGRSVCWFPSASKNSCTYASEIFSLVSYQSDGGGGVVRKISLRSGAKRGAMQCVSFYLLALSLKPGLQQWD